MKDASGGRKEQMMLLLQYFLHHLICLFWSFFHITLIIHFIFHLFPLMNIEMIC